MRLSEFLHSYREAIVDYSVEFASKIPALSGPSITVETLRDHFPLVLDAIIHDLEQPQTRAESILKSQGLGPLPHAQTAAQFHGASRAASGLNIEELVAEFRVLRSSVLRLWSEASSPDEFASEDTLRFNEAIDQAVAESIAFFHAELERWRGLLLGVVGHDLRGPLNALHLTCEVLMQEARHTPFVMHAEVIARAARRMSALLDSLLEYNKASLGAGMVLQRAPCDLARACQEELLLLRAALPQRHITFTCPPSCGAYVDASRMREALANLVFNAADHGVTGCSIDVLLEHQDELVRLSVTNAAAGMDGEVLRGLFEPLRDRSRHDSSGRERRHLGLGLFIVRAIARAHGGDATAEMLGDHVRFTISIPRSEQAVRQTET